MAESSFFSIVYISIFLIVVLHFSIKSLLKEDIFRHNIFGGGKAMENYVSIGEIKNELLDHIKTHLSDIESNKIKTNKIKGANYYSKWHDSDLHHEETDLSKYFDIEQSIPDTKQLLKHIQCKKIKDMNRCKQVKKPLIDHQTGNPLHVVQGSDGSFAPKPDWWSYANEKVMNGGQLDGVSAYDDAQDSFVLYQDASKIREANYQRSYPYIVNAEKY